jgi:predicted transcriptional regulator YdeE
MKMPKVDIKSHPAVSVVGLKYHGKNENDEIMQMWGAIMQRMDQIPNLAQPLKTAYGISLMDETFEDSGAFDYIGGYPVSEKAVNLPEDLVAFDIPEGTYAVIACQNLASLQEAYDALYNRWLPDSGYVLDLSNGNFCFELYGEEFDLQAGKEKLTIWAPVKAK